jgi:hypothetical protein
MSNKFCYQLRYLASGGCIPLNAAVLCFVEFFTYRIWPLYGGVKVRGFFTVPTPVFGHPFFRLYPIGPWFSFIWWRSSYYEMNLVQTQNVLVTNARPPENHGYKLTTSRLRIHSFRLRIRDLPATKLQPPGELTTSLLQKHDLPIT